MTTVAKPDQLLREEIREGFEVLVNVLQDIHMELEALKSEAQALNEKFTDFFATQLPEWEPEKQEK